VLLSSETTHCFERKKIKLLIAMQIDDLLENWSYTFRRVVGEKAVNKDSEGEK
jgi:hypothetical protein